MANLTHTIENILGNRMTKWLFCTLLIAAIVLVRYIPLNILLLVKELYIQVIFAVLIAFLACTEPIYALLLTLFFAVSIYEANNKTLAMAAVAKKLSGGGLNVYSAQSGACGGMDPSMSTVYRYLNDERNEPVPNTGATMVMHPARSVDDIISEKNLQAPVIGDRVPGPDNTIPAKVMSSVSYVDIEPAAVTEARGWSHPASRTMSENLAEMGTGFVSKGNLSQIQMNIVTGIDPETAAEFKPGILNAQGITVAPMGFDPVSSKHSIPLV